MKNILPYPKKVKEFNGFFNTENCEIILRGIDDNRVFKVASKIKDLLSEADCTHHRLGTECSCARSIIIEKDNVLQSEEYNLTISIDSIFISGGTDVACFYALKTLEQIINQYGKKLPSVSINDYPDMSYRGFYYDASRGRIPSVEGIKRMVDILAGMKINSLQIYVEHSFDFNEFRSLGRSSDYVLTPNDILEIDDYCYQNFIDFIPSMATFGHLYELLSLNEYKELCELDNFKPEWHFWRERMAHHTIDPSNPNSIKVICSLIDQYLPLFRSKYFNICCDETFDLCTGKNKGKNKGNLYCEFVNKIIGHVTDNGKTVMMWGDIVLEHPETLKTLPKSTILLNWDYGANPRLDKIESVYKSEFQQIVCPGTSSWMRLIENPENSIPNIVKMIECGYKYRANGALITNWGDYGHPASFESSIYGTITAACKSWNVETSIDETFELDFSRIIYGLSSNAVKYITELSSAQENAPWISFFDWNKKRDISEFSGSIDSSMNAEQKCAEIIQALSAYKQENRFIDHLSVAAQGIALLNMAEQIILSNGNFTEWRFRADEWLRKYQERWLETSKLSEFCEIRNFIMQIPND